MNNRYTARSFMGLVLTLALAVPALAPRTATAAEVAPPSVSVPAAMVGTLDGNTAMWSRRASNTRHGASTIKMLTALVVRDHAKLNDVVVVHKKAAAISDGDVDLVAGQRITVQQLLRLMMVASANDAAEALAIHVAGSEAAFVAKMNAKAQTLGLTRTRAVDPHGLSEREVVTAGELAVLARHVMADEALRPMLTMRSVTVTYPGGRKATFKATNKMLGNYWGIRGVKTGYTSEAGFVFVGSAKRGEVELVGVVMGAKSNDARFAEMRRLLDWGFAHSRMRTVVPTATPLGSVPVSGGTETSVTVHAIRAFKTVEFDGDPFTVKVNLDPDVHAPVRAGQKLGAIDVYRGGAVVQRRGLYADKAVAAVEPSPPVPAERKLGKSTPVATVWDGLQSLIRVLAS